LYLNPYAPVSLRWRCKGRCVDCMTCAVWSKPSTSPALLTALQRYVCCLALLG
jgi:hypothetical protein